MSGGLGAVSHGVAEWLVWALFAFAVVLFLVWKLLVFLWGMV